MSGIVVTVVDMVMVVAYVLLPLLMLSILLMSLGEKKYHQDYMAWAIEMRAPLIHPYFRIILKLTMRKLTIPVIYPDDLHLASVTIFDTIYNFQPTTQHPHYS